MNYTYDYGNNYNDLFNNVLGGSGTGTSILIGLGLFLIVLSFVFLVLGILTLIINWKILKKTGNEGWKALIPIYNTWSICEGIGVNPHWSWVVVVAPGVLGLIPGIGAIIASVIAIYFAIIYCISLARSFDRDDGFAVLLFFFFPIAGFFLFGKEYVGKKPCHDFVFDDWLKLNNKEENTSEAKVVNEASTKEEDTKYCSECGTKVAKDAKFCPNCGKDV